MLKIRHENIELRWRINAIHLKLDLSLKKPDNIFVSDTVSNLVQFFSWLKVYATDWSDPVYKCYWEMQKIQEGTHRLNEGIG